MFQRISYFRSSSSRSGMASRTAGGEVNPLNPLSGIARFGSTPCKPVISACDFVTLPYTSDLTQAGIAYARRSLPRLFGSSDSTPIERLLRMVIGVAVELSFRRYLVQNRISFDVEPATPFSRPERYDILLGRHRCRIEAFLISHRNQEISLGSNPDWMLELPVFVPQGEYSIDDLARNNVFIFSLLNGRILPSPPSARITSQVNSPEFLIHAMPDAWARPAVWNPIEPLALKSESKQKLVVELGGQDRDRGYLSHSVELPPQTRLELEEPFYSLSHLYVNSRPQGRLGIHSLSREVTHLIEPAKWRNIWVHGIEICMLGWIPLQEFHWRSRPLEVDCHMLRHDHVRTRRLAVLSSELRPLADLLRPEGE